MRVQAAQTMRFRGPLPLLGRMRGCVLIGKLVERDPVCSEGVNGHSERVHVAGLVGAEVVRSEGELWCQVPRPPAGPYCRLGPSDFVADAAESKVT